MGRTISQLCRNVVNHLNNQTGVENATCTPDGWGNLKLRADVDGNNLYCDKVSYENDCVGEWNLFYGCERHAKLTGDYSSEKCQHKFSQKIKDKVGFSIFLHNRERLHSAFK
mgnify:CR=1 FL=1